MIQKYIILIIGVVLLLGTLSSCNMKKGKNTPIKSPNEPSRPISELKENVLSRGDINSYKELYYYYFDKTGEDEFLTWALIMANKYNYSGAFLDVFYALQRANNYLGEDNDYGLDHLDGMSRNMALEYLKKAVDNNEPQAKDILGNYYLEGKYVNKDVELGKKLIEEYEKELSN